MIYWGLVVTGTGTGVGKTAVATALVSLFREGGRRVGVLKPVETGCEGPDLTPLDGLALARAAAISVSGFTGPSPDEVPIERIVPWRFPEPLAPEEAARLSVVEISVDRIYQAMDAWSGSCDLVVVETAGGVMVPLNARFTFLDLLQGLELPVVVAAANRLGVINHSLLTLESLRSRDLNPIAVVLSRIDPSPDQSAPGNADAIARHGAVPVFEVPFAKGQSPAEAAALALAPHMDGILRAAEKEWKRVLTRYAQKGVSGS